MRINQRGHEWRLAVFDVAGDVFEHHNRVVDDKADRNR
jgi:hypothetical protein